MIAGVIPVYVDERLPPGGSYVMADCPYRNFEYEPLNEWAPVDRPPLMLIWNKED